MIELKIIHPPTPASGGDAKHITSPTGKKTPHRQEIKNENLSAGRKLRMKNLPRWRGIKGVENKPSKL